VFTRNIHFLKHFAIYYKMNILDKKHIVFCWKNNVEDALPKGRMVINFDNQCFLLDNNNPQCMINVYRNNVYIGSYTHIESFLFDFENMYFEKYKKCIVRVLKQQGSKKRKRD
jgi:hypothetical protein